MSDVALRVMSSGDVLAADSLRRLIGWNQTPEDWRRLLELEPQGCFVALREAELVGTVTTTTYGQTLAWIGMMLVHPQYRRQGLGTRLMRQALDYLAGRAIECVRLDATPAGYPLYEQLGFAAEWTLTRWQRPAGGALAAASGSPPATRALAETDWGAVEALDHEAFGAPRGRLLRRLAAASRVARVWPAAGAPAGFGLLRAGANADYLGPVVCASAEGARALTAALLGDSGARPIFWDAPDPNATAKATAPAFGFAPVRPLTRMRLGPEAAPNSPQVQFAIADPAVG
jgi:GNAT superfamily N-acetyltransferase